MNYICSPNKTYALLINFQILIVSINYLYLQQCCIIMLRIVYTYGLLLLFLFPTLEKGIHALEHEEEEHCAAYEETHLHEKHHNCNLCDYNVEPLSAFSSYAIIEHYTTFFEFSFSYLSFSESFTHYYFSLRAPPQLV